MIFLLSENSPQAAMACEDSVALRAGRNTARDTLALAWKTRTFGDITFVAEDKDIRCHMLVVAPAMPAVMSVYKRMCKPDTHIVMIVQGEYELLYGIVKFLYTGELTVSRNKLMDLEKLARELGVTALSCAIEKYEKFSAAEALNTLKNDVNTKTLSTAALFRQRHAVAPQHPPTTINRFQPSTGEQPPTGQDQANYHMYGAATSRASLSFKAPVSYILERQPFSTSPPDGSNCNSANLPVRLLV